MVSNKFFKDLIEKELKVKDLKINQKGWDSTVCLVNNKYIFRFPRRKEVQTRLGIEIKLLPKIQKKVSLKIPNFKYITKEFVGYEMIKGDNLTQNWLKQCSNKKIVAKQLGEFLSELHSFPQKSALKAGVKYGNTKQECSQFYRDIKKKVYPLLSKKDQNWADRMFKEYLGQKKNFSYGSKLVHADFGSDHILVGKGRVRGIIDFGDMILGDPALDFCGLAWFGDEVFFNEIIKNYRYKINVDFLQRVQFYINCVPFHILLASIVLKRNNHKEGFQVLNMIKKGKKNI